MKRNTILLVKLKTQKLKEIRKTRKLIVAKRYSTSTINANLNSVNKICHIMSQ